jgi:hypothetical protein
MTILSNARVIVALRDPELNDVDLQELTQNLRQQIAELDGVYQADLVAVENPPEGSKAIGGYLLGSLKAEVNPANIKSLFSFLTNRLSGKTIKMSVETPDGRKLNIEASSQIEFEFAMKQANDFIAGK